MARKSNPAAAAALAAIAPSLPPGHVQCACDADCRKPGRMSPVAEGLHGFSAKDRVCIDHYYILLYRARVTA